MDRRLRAVCLVGAIAATAVIGVSPPGGTDLLRTSFDAGSVCDHGLITVGPLTTA